MEAHLLFTCAFHKFTCLNDYTLDNNLPGKYLPNEKKVAQSTLVDYNLLFMPALHFTGHWTPCLNMCLMRKKCGVPTLSDAVRSDLV